MPAKRARRNTRTRAGLDHRLVEREEELAQLAAAFDQAGGGAGGLVYIESAAGNGRSSLLAAAALLATRAGLRVLRAAGRATEREFSFGLALQLFEDQRLSAAAGSGPPAIRGPLELAQQLSRRPATPEAQCASPEERFGAIHGLFWAAVDTTARSRQDGPKQPLALLVDDAHHADAASLQFLAYLAVRVRELPIALVVTSRSGERPTHAEALNGIREAAAAVLGPTELSPVAATGLARAAFPRAGPAFWAECAELTGGNPFLLRALLDDLGRKRSLTPGTAATAGELVPDAVVATVKAQLSALTEAESVTASAVAVLGDGAALSDVAAVAGLDYVQTSRAADTLADLRLLRAGVPLSFTSPLLKRAVYRSIPALERELLQGRAERSAMADESPTMIERRATAPSPGPVLANAQPDASDVTDHARLALMAIEGSTRGEQRTRISRLAELAWDHGAQWGARGDDPGLAVRLADALLLVDDLELGLEILADGTRRATTEHAPAENSAIACCRGWLLYHRGEIAAAATTAEEALASSPDAAGGARHALRGVLAACHIQLGQLEMADAALSMLEAPDDIPECDLPGLLDLRAQLALARRRPVDALADALEAGRRVQTGPGGVPPGRVAWRSTAALAQIALDEPAAAQELAVEELDAARRGDVRRVTIRALRALGLASAGRRRLELLQEAVTLGAGLPVRLEYLHALVDLGAATRRANRRGAARQPLIKALELARELRAIDVAERAQAEISASYPQRRHARTTGTQSLTASEQRVALLAAQGLTTRQIAAELFVTPKTVEFHLRHVYRKLEVPSTRADLTRVLLGGDAVSSISTEADHLQPASAS